MNRAHVSQTYDASAEAYQDSPIGGNNEIQKAMLEHFLHFLAPKSRVMDLGCGSGANAKTIRESHALRRVTGLDISTEMLRRAQITAPECKFLHRDIRTVSYPENAYDAAVVASVSIHLDEDELVGLIQNISKALIPDGLLFLNFWTGDYSGFKRLDFASRPMMVCYHDEPFLLKLMRSCSFAQLRAKRFQRTIETGYGPETITETYYFGHLLKDRRAIDILPSNVTAPFI